MANYEIALGVERLTVSNTAVALANIPSGTQTALIKVKTATVCFTEDGITTPTSSVGMEAIADSYITLTTDPHRFKAIRAGGTDATLIVTYYSGA